MSSTLLRDPDTLFFQRDGVRRRIIAAYWVVVVLSVPMWWYTTSIQRLSLPSSRIKSTPDTLQLPVSICIEGDTDRSLGPEFLRSTSTESSRWRGLTLQVTEDDVCGERSYFISTFGSLQEQNLWTARISSHNDQVLYLLMAVASLSLKVRRGSLTKRTLTSSRSTRCQRCS